MFFFRALLFAGVHGRGLILIESSGMPGGICERKGHHRSHRYFISG
jgi:hypothetical protein